MEAGETTKRTKDCWLQMGLQEKGIPGFEATRFKAHLVAKGFSQREGIDFNEVFSPIVKHSSIRVLLAMVALFDLELEQLDVKITFLHGDLEEKNLYAIIRGFRYSRKRRSCLFVEKIIIWLETISKAVVQAVRCIYACLWLLKE